MKQSLLKVKLDNADKNLLSIENKTFLRRERERERFSSRFQYTHTIYQFVIINNIIIIFFNAEYRYTRYTFAVAPSPYRPDTARFNKFLPGKVLGAFRVYWHTCVTRTFALRDLYICLNINARMNMYTERRSRFLIRACKSCSINARRCDN